MRRRVCRRAILVLLWLWPSAVVGVHAAVVAGVVHIRLAISALNWGLVMIVVLLVVAGRAVIVLVGAVIVFVVAVHVGLAVAAGSRA